MKSNAWWILVFVFFCALLPQSTEGADTSSRKIVDPEEEGVNLRAILPTPVYSTYEIPTLYYDYEKLQPRLKLDKNGHMRELEFIALKDSKFVYKSKTFKFGRIHVYEVETDEYPSQKPLYIDSNYVVRCFKDDPARNNKRPEKSEILAALKGMVGFPYRWGGNYHEGIPQQLNFYPVGEVKDLEEFLQENRSAWILEGVDCSGMLYEASNGSTPRNTSDLVDFGLPVDIAGLPSDEIAAKLQPLDLIVWAGHVLVVYDSENIIESRPRYSDGHKGGVRILPLQERLEEIMKTRKPVNNYYPDLTGDKRFVVRRFMN